MDRGAGPVGSRFREWIGVLGCLPQVQIVDKATGRVRNRFREWIRLLDVRNRFRV